MCTDHFALGLNYDRDQRVSNIGCGYGQFFCLNAAVKMKLKANLCIMVAKPYQLTRSQARFMANSNGYASGDSTKVGLSC